ncbi:MAG TPA: PEP-CTERM sorting domain-containing protein [Candidatus Methylacidiphilales bacterium]
MKKLLLTTGFALALAAGTQAHAQTTIADWNFDSTADSSTITSVTPGTTSASISADLGSGTADSVHASSSAAYSSPAGNGGGASGGGGGSFSSNNWAVGDSYAFQVSTLNYNNIQVSWDQASSSTGPKDFTLEYSINGGAFVADGSYSVLVNGSPNTAWSGSIGAARNPAYTLSFNLGNLGANVTSLTLELVDADTTSEAGGTVASSGTDRVDNFLVTGTLAATPEPSTWVLVVAALGLLACVRARRLSASNR